MKRGVGSPLNPGFGLSGVSRPVRQGLNGIYPNKSSGHGQYGGTAYPTVIEAYNRDSDYKRWKYGQEYYFGAGKTWADFSVNTLVRSLLDTGEASSIARDVTTFLPSNTSPESAWAVTIRTRGSVILPQAIEASDITITTDHPQEQEHRLILDVSSTLSADQIRNWEIYIGDQFEDSATGLVYPNDLIEKPVSSIAFTLVEVDPVNGLLVFDLSRGFVRQLFNGRISWRLLQYDRRNPVYWQRNGSRYLCNSFRFHCSCPDFSGRAYADTLDTNASKQRKFPLPGAGRAVDNSWEAEGVGYYKQWRDLSRRSDRRRECKHIHALRWSCGVPFYEPSDYPTGDQRGVFGVAAAAERRFKSEDILRYNRNRLISYDLFLPGLAAASGIELDPRGDLLADGSPVRPDLKPVFWATRDEPAASRSQINDWWLKKGTQSLAIYSPTVGRYVDAVSEAGVSVPVLEFRDPPAEGAPVIVL